MSKNFDYAFDEYLKKQPEETAKALQEFSPKLEKAGFHFGRFLIPTFYKAHFLSLRQEHILKRLSGTLTQILNTAIRLYFEEGHLSHLFRVDAETKELLQIDPGFSKAVIFARFHCILQGEALKVLEFNCDTPAGIGYGDQLETLFLSEPFLADFFNEHPILPASRCQNMMNALLEAYEEFGGFETPNIAIMDWRNVRSQPEILYVQKFLQEKGYKAFHADPRELKYKNGKLYFKDSRIHVILRRVTLEEILQRPDEMRDVLKAYKERTVCMVNPLRAHLASSKAILSVLSNPEFDHFFTENENKMKREYLPWTRRLQDADDFYGRKKIYLIDFLKDEQETLVLKPSSGIGSKNVFIGRETSERDWNQAIDNAVKQDWVVQEYVDIPSLTVPEVQFGKFNFEYKKYNFNLFSMGGIFSGAFARLGSETVVSMARKGGMIPSLVCEHVPERLEAVS